MTNMLACRTTFWHRVSTYFSCEWLILDHDPQVSLSWNGVVLCQMYPTVFYCLSPQLTWSPKSITIMWGRRGSLNQSVTSPRSPLHLLPLLQRSRRAFQRTLVLLLPQAAVKPLRSLLKTPGGHMRKYLWLFRSCADSGLNTVHLYLPLLCTNSWIFPYGAYSATFMLPIDSKCLFDKSENWAAAKYFSKVFLFEWDEGPVKDKEDRYFCSWDDGQHCGLKKINCVWSMFYGACSQRTIIFKESFFGPVPENLF